MEDFNPSELGLSKELWEPLAPEVKAVIMALLARIRDLESKLKMNSSNSSKPPSSDPPWAKPKKVRKEKSSKRRGGQAGHPFHGRVLVPQEEVDEVHDLYPESCQHCGIDFDGNEPGPEPQRHQVFDLPAVRPRVREFRRHGRECRSCGKTTWRSEKGVPVSGYGARAHAWTAILTVRYRLSKREVRSVIPLLTGVPLSLGVVCKIEENVSQALAASVEELRLVLPEQKVVNQDETGWRQENKKAWLWVTVTDNYAVYKVDLKRNGEVARSLLGGVNFQGHSVTDRYKAYNCYPMERRGICHSHINRDYKAIAEREGPGKPIGQALCRQEIKVFDAWRDFKQGIIDRPQLQQRIVPIKDSVKKLLTDGTKCRDTKVAGRCADILKHWEALWAFAYVDGVPLTNNTAEQAIRPWVLWRKGSFGTQSERGSRFVERMMSVAETCRRQGRDLLNFVTEAVEAWMEGRPGPSLVTPPP